MARPKSLEEWKQATKTALQTIIDNALSDSVDRIVVMTPLVDDPSGNGQRYFIVATCGPEGFRSDRIIVDEDDIRETVRTAFATRGRPVVINDCDDELYAIKLCEILWPSERVTRIRQAIEVERKRSPQ